VRQEANTEIVFAMGQELLEINDVMVGFAIGRCGTNQLWQLITGHCTITSAVTSTNGTVGPSQKTFLFQRNLFSSHCLHESQVIAFRRTHLINQNAILP
jgi:hypothetical protein